MLTPDAKRQLRVWLEETPHEVVVECKQTHQGIGWGRMLSTPGTSGCSPAQSRTSPWCMHTHPRACYERNGTYYGWPSGADYCAFLDQQGTEHLVCALEGIYRIRSTPESCRRWARLSDAEKDALEHTWDVPSDHVNRTPARALASLVPHLKGWVSVELFPYS
jgi:hypothetical protein